MKSTALKAMIGPRSFCFCGHARETHPLDDACAECECREFDLGEQPSWWIIAHADAFAALLEACETEQETKCATQTEDWHDAERDDQLCFGDIHCSICPVTAARLAKAAALRAVHAIGADHG